MRGVVNGYIIITALSLYN